MDNSKPTDWRFRIIDRISEVRADQWNSCANPVTLGSADAISYNPFISHEFLEALETSRSASAETGWAPCHLLLEGDGELQGVVPMYVKQHSMGEYVFDFQWADAFSQAGGSYYPKLQISVPFTPVTGRRILAKTGIYTHEVEKRLLEKCIQLADSSEFSSVHITFMPREQWEMTTESGFLPRIDQQFHWQNQGYRNFEDFLDTLSAKKRRNIKRERRIAVEPGIQIEWVTGAELKESHWDAFFRFYLDTGSRKWGSPYLNREFFSILGQSMSDKILLVMCRLGGRYIAGALNLIGSDTLFGRYWGCLDDFPCLHFEVCYYQAIEFAIKNNLSFVEAGAQGEHKLARGYLPKPTYSAHWIANPRFRKAIADYLWKERQVVSGNIQYWNDHSPFKTSRNR